MPAWQADPLAGGRELRRVDDAVLQQPFRIWLAACANLAVGPKVLVDEDHATPVRKLVCDDLAQRPMRKPNATSCPLGGFVLSEHPLGELARLCALPVPAIVESLTQFLRADTLMRTVTHA